MLILDLGFHLQANKNRDYRESVIALFRAITCFLDEQGFTKRSLESSIVEDLWSFRLVSDDLTESGMNWVKEHLDKWMERMDRRTQGLTFEDFMDALRETVKG